MDATQWAAHVGILSTRYAYRGLQSNPGADEQIESLVSRPEATIAMPLWGFPLSEETALSYGTRFQLRVHGPFHAVGAWLHSGVKGAEQELIGSGQHRVVNISRSEGTTLIDIVESSVNARQTM